MEHGDLCRHRLRRRALPLAAKGHEHAARTDGGIEPFRKAAFGAHVQVRCKGKIRFRKAAVFLCFRRFRRSNPRLCLLRRAVRIEERAGKVHDALPLPIHRHAAVIRNGCNDGRFEVFLFGQRGETLRVRSSHDHRHALLGFADGKLRAVQPFILLRHRVEVDAEAFRQLAHGDAHAARAEVVAALDETRRFRVAEQALELAFFRRVALLHLCAAGLDGTRVVRFGGSRCAAAAVAPGAPTKEDHHIAGCRRFAPHVLFRHRADHRADFHALCSIAFMVDFIHKARRKADLVAVGAVTCGCRRHKLALRELARKRFRHGAERVGRARHAHRLVHIRPSGKRVADRAADAGGRAAKGLDLRRMVVRFIFKEQQPGLRAFIRLHVDLHRAGIDLIGFVQPLKLPGLLQVFRSARRHVHQRHGLVHAHFVPDGLIARISLSRTRMIERNVRKLRSESRVPAMIRPIGIKHAHLRDGRVAALSLEVFLAAEEVIQVHRQAKALMQRKEAGFIKLREARERFHAFRRFKRRFERLHRSKGCFPAFHRVDDILFHRGKRGFIHRAKEHVDLRRAHERALPLGDELNALACGVRTLVKLAGQGFHRKHRGSPFLRQGFINIVHRRLGEHVRHATGEQRFGYALHIIAVEQPEPGELRKAKQRLQLVEQGFCLIGLRRLLFHKNSINHASPYPACAASARAPMSFL